MRLLLLLLLPPASKCSLIIATATIAAAETPTLASTCMQWAIGVAIAATAAAAAAPGTLTAVVANAPAASAATIAARTVNRWLSAETAKALRIFWQGLRADLTAFMALQTLGTMSERS